MPVSFISIKKHIKFCYLPNIVQKWCEEKKKDLALFPQIYVKLLYTSESVSITTVV